MRSACFSYDLELLGKEDCQAYSATNPGAVRFDVLQGVMFELVKISHHSINTHVPPHL